MTEPRKAKSHRIALTLSQELLEDLEDWASQQKRPVASLCVYLLSREVDRAVASGEYTRSSTRPSEAVKLYAKAFLERAEVDEEVLELVAEATGLETVRLREALKFDRIVDP